MAYNDRPMVESKPASGTPQPGDALGGLIQSPDLNREAEPRQHAIRDISQAREVIKTVQQAGRNRAIVNARIESKINAERPYDQTRLDAEGLGWRQNFSTRVLPTIIDKVWPRFIQAVQGLKYFTNSSLSDKWSNNTEKTEFFRSEITKTIQEHKGWIELLESIAFTNCTFGHAVVGWLDEFSFWPKAFSQSESYVTDGCRQTPAFAQVVVLRETMLPHELYELIKDKDEAKTAGWNIENAIERINSASPEQLRNTLGTGGTTESWYQNAVRELTLGSSYMAGASVISVYNLLAVEVTGKVSHYRLAGDELDEIFSKDDRFASPEEYLAFFSYERGNGTLHGSKGIGRQAYELSGMMERSRNELVDRAILSGKTIVQGDVKRLHTFRMSVVGSTVIFPNGWNILENKVDGNLEPFLKLDAYFGSLIDQIVGNVSPTQVGQGEAFRSSASWQLLAAREEESKDARISRFITQFVALIQTMQRRICDADCIDKDAKMTREKLLEKMTKEELKEIAESPVAGAIVDLTPIERQMVVALAAEKQGNPLYNQRALQVEDITARLGAEFANRVLLPVEDPTEENEQTRLQLMEITLLAMGQPVPVSPRDNPEIHLKVLLPATEQLASQIMEGAGETAGLEAMLAHISEHVTAAQAAGVPKEALAQAMDIVKKGGAVIAQLKDLDAQAAELSQQDAEAPIE